MILHDIDLTYRTVLPYTLYTDNQPAQDSQSLHAIAGKRLCSFPYTIGCRRGD
jgi:hypothetical protein